MTDSREFKDSPWVQGADEIRSWEFDTAPWPGSGNPTGVTVKLFNDQEHDVSAANLTGSPSVNGTYIRTPSVHSLQDGKSYRIEVAWTRGTETLEAYGGIDCK